MAKYLEPIPREWTPDYTPQGLSPEERKRKMKLMAQAYFDARNMVREKEGRPLLQITDLPKNMQAYLMDKEPEQIETQTVPASAPHVPGWSSVGEILTPGGVKGYKDIPF